MIRIRTWWDRKPVEAVGHPQCACWRIAEPTLCWFSRHHELRKASRNRRNQRIKAYNGLALRHGSPVQGPSDACRPSEALRSNLFASPLDTASLTSARSRRAHLQDISPGVEIGSPGAGPNEEFGGTDSTLLEGRSPTPSQLSLELARASSGGHRVRRIATRCWSWFAVSSKSGHQMDAAAAGKLGKV